MPSNTGPTTLVKFSLVVRSKLRGSLLVSSILPLIRLVKTSKTSSGVNDDEFEVGLSNLNLLAACICLFKMLFAFSFGCRSPWVMVVVDFLPFPNANF